MKNIATIIIVLLVLGCSEDYKEDYTNRLARIDTVKEAYPDSEIYSVKPYVFIIVDNGYVYRVITGETEGISYITQLKEILIKNTPVQEFSDEQERGLGKYYAITLKEGILLDEGKVYKYKAKGNIFYRYFL
jgi:hypothetical protein